MYSFLENLQGLITLKIYQADQQKADEMDAESQNFRRITMKVLTMQLNSTSVMDIVAYGGAAIGMAASGKIFKMQYTMGMHIVSTRYLKCAHYKTRTWCKKVMTKEC